MTMRAGLAVLWLAALGAPACGFAARPAEFEFAPDYQARLLGEERRLSLAELRGQVVLLNTFATWCAPCRAEMPGFEATHRRYKTRGLSVVAVNVDEGGDDADVLTYARTLGLTFTVLRDPANRFSKHYRVLGVPESFLIDRNGRLVKRWRGEIDVETEANRKLVEAVLAEPAMVPSKKRAMPSVSRTNPASPRSEAARGKRLAEQRGCYSCHSLDGSPSVGPTWLGIAGTRVLLADGRQVLRDAAYLRRAIAMPDAELVAGFPASLMASGIPGKPLTAVEIDALVAYLESLTGNPLVGSAP
jgi:peroxiredoxin